MHFSTDDVLILASYSTVSVSSLNAHKYDLFGRVSGAPTACAILHIRDAKNDINCSFAACGRVYTRNELTVDVFVSFNLSGGQ